MPNSDLSSFMNMGPELYHSKSSPLNEPKFIFLHHLCIDYINLDSKYHTNLKAIVAPPNSSRFSRFLDHFLKKNIQKFVNTPPFTVLSILQQKRKKKLFHHLQIGIDGASCAQPRRHAWLWSKDRMCDCPSVIWIGCDCGFNSSTMAIMLLTGD